MTEHVPKIYAAMAAIMNEVEAIGKDEQNKQQNFKFRSAAQAYDAMHPLLAKYEIITVPRVSKLVGRKERPSSSGGVLSFTILEMEFDFICCKDGSKITVGPMYGEGMDSGDKGCNKAMTVAHKYAIFQLFVIPYKGMDDPDSDSPQLGGAPDPFGGWGAEQPIATDPLGDWGQPAPPAPAPHSVSTNPNTFVIAGEGAAEQHLAINSEEDAVGVASFIIELAKNAHADSLDSLKGFWNKNKKLFDYLDQHFPAQLGRIKFAFTTLRQQLNSGDQK